MSRNLILFILFQLSFLNSFANKNFLLFGFNFRGIELSDKFRTRSGILLFGHVFSANKPDDFVIETGITFNKTYSYPELINTYSNKVVTTGQANVYSSKHTYSEIQIPLQFMYHFQLMNQKKFILKYGPMLSLNTSVWSVSLSERYEVLNDNSLNRNLPAVRNQYNPATYPGIGGVVQVNYKLQKGDLIFSTRFQFLDGSVQGNLLENHRTTFALGYLFK
jgi:hypothetical protein